VAEVFNQPFDQAIEYFLGKVPLSHDQVLRMSREARARAFWISHVNQEGLVEGFYGQVYRALAGGETYADFKRSISAQFDALGYSRMNPFRLQTIFETNMNLAYSAGNWRAMTDPDVVKARPLGRWHAMMDSRTRPSHAGLHGRVWPLKDAFWETHWPPLDWGCRCTVDSLSAEEARAQGLEVEGSTGQIMVEPLDPVTRDRQPARPLMVDPNWAYNPGQTAWGRPPAWRARQSYEQTLGPGWKPLVKGGWREAGRPEVLHTKESPTGLGPDVESRQQAEALLEEILGGQMKVFKDPQSKPVLATVDLARHLAQAGGRGPYLPLLPHVIEGPAEIWLQPLRSEVSGRVVMRRAYIQSFERKGGRGVVTVAEYQKGAWVALTTYPERSARRVNDRFRWGVLQWAEK